MSTQNKWTLKLEHQPVIAGRLLKTEWVPTIGYSSFAEAEREILDYILGYYSQLRPHHYNSGLAPNESERRYWLGYKDVAKIS